ncbi:Eco57I restriction-modification methylase domain-containing protein [Brachyspira pilosicoli]|uniref:site-specific DNA-methyltransferase (adenine-specific) n=1 Tax=Brachyspira pilosicoli TaxID=52584 RepID=A0A5C8EGQ9_BRAPL|nr:Eco57I restriction-modification methylase domain-containing protein [Brachyspira pilosicoli]TXJ37227.1 type II restriction endonuclease [Brachyspira pilosicoli]
MAKNNNLTNISNFRFDEAYNKEKWALHFGESFQEEYGAISNEDEILEKHSDFLEKVIWIGDLNTDNGETIGVYEVYIKNTNLASRVKISRLCSKIITGGERNTYGKGIFFILYNDKKNNYRVSYVKHDKVAVLGNKDVRFKKDYSNPKRYTFLLGEGIKVHTPESRLKSDIFNSVESIENAFSVEPVNKEFYNGVKEYFDNIYKDVIKYFNKDENRAKEFALRFLGRILFCWFLREKELIPSEILNSKVFENLKYKKNYYSDVLEDLFFNVLNIDMEKRSFSKDRVISNYEKEIPFLNGGLFSKKEDDEAVKIIDDDIVKGLFEFFEMYNFTVDESAPFDVEISIDPEMLGRIFENLLAEINPETKKNARKEKGSFYTPREIVDYMVMEAIKLYLYKKLPDIKDKIDRIFDIEDSIEYSDKERESILKNIHDMIILDPACGSGAFPLGILQRVFDIINKLDPNHDFYRNSIIDKLPPVIKDEFNRLYDNNKYNYAYKLGILQNMIHGSDIQPIAIEISRLRAFLSLIVEEKKNIKKNNLGIEALPNLEFHFVCANSLVKLIDEDNVSDTFTKLIFDGIIENMQEISKKFFEAYTKEKKQTVYTEFEAFKHRVSKIEALDQETNDIKENIISWNPFTNSASKFFNHNIQFGIKRNFDIIIGNPPYGAKISSKEKKYFENNYITSRTKKTTKGLLKGSLNTYSLFTEKSISLLENNGILVFITPISIIASDSMCLLHSLLEEKCESIKISNYADRPKQIFKDASVCVSILECIKTNTTNKNILCTKMYRKSNEDTIDNILNDLEFIDVKEFKLLGRYPKISKEIEVNILRKLFKIKNDIGSLLKDKGNPIYYRMAGGRYFKVITNYSTTKADSEKVIYFDKKIANTIGAILSSNLYFWYYQIFSDNLNMKKYDIESFKIPIDKLDNDKIKYIEKLYSKYLDDIEKNVIIHGKTNYKNINSFKEYKIRMSKNIIDEIDDFICPLYKLTKEETDFIKNYEIKYRMSGKED